MAKNESVSAPGRAKKQFNFDLEISEDLKEIAEIADAHASEPFHLEQAA